MTVLIISVLSHAIHGGAPNNRGNEFIIGFMENQGTSIDVEIFVTTMRTITVNVNVTTPRYSSSINEQFSVKAGEVKQLLFPPGIRPTGNSKVPNAVHVKADDDVVIYAVNKEKYSNDAYLGVPVDVLGTEYYAVTFYPPTQQCELMIVGVEDGTTVTIKFPASMQQSVTWNGQSYAAGDTLTGTVDRFDTWQLISKGDLTGAYITSDKNVGVISGNKKTRIGSGGSSDHLCEMMIPVGRWGKNYISVPIPARTVGDKFRFIASEAGTTITISGGHTETITLANAGDFVEKDIESTAYCSIKADKAIMVVQFVLSQQLSTEPSDPAMMILPPIEQFAADYTFTTPKYSSPPATYDSFFMFVIREDDKDGLKVDGSSFPSSTVYHQVTHNGVNYAAGYIEVAEGTHTVRHDSPIKVFGGYLYGKAKYETYAFSTGTRLAPINTPCTPTTTEIGDGLDNDCDGLIDEEACWDSNSDDDGDSRQNEDCATPPPVDGEWADWSQWTACSVTCFSTTGASNSGSRSRERTCTNPAPAYDGKQCVGQASEADACSITNVYCPVDGAWTSWENWGTCTVTCGSGSQSRPRTCTDPSPQYGGADCAGDNSEFKQGCNPSACPTASVNNYVQHCISGYFTCLNSTNKCIEESKKCDCNSDCSDGSDELASYAGCPQGTVQYCQASLPSGAQGMIWSCALVTFAYLSAIVFHFLN
ncbi:IgGFc-binding protein-like [Ostrea edulis]|uniref:IgGFc-binding protein-like n=1 Tax=Ostrea edulis TaxID=37623 RepID=UPI0024AF49B6|nr:IgGFc-binding protein-like [Ostrea edulis]